MEQDFWYALRQAGLGDPLLGLEIAERQMIAVVRRRFPSSYFDWREVADKAVEDAAVSFDPSRGKVCTYLCKCAETVAWGIIRSNRHPSKMEFQFSDIEPEDGREIEFPSHDEYHHIEKAHRILAMLDFRTFSSPSVAGHTFGELAALLDLGKDHRTIAREWGVSEPTLRLCIREVQNCIINLGVLRDCSAGVQPTRG